jgi:hypothetical protein
VDSEAAGDDFIPIKPLFWYWGGNRKAAEVARRPVQPANLNTL